MNLIFLDTECTGTEAEDRIIQVAFKDSGGLYAVNELFKPPLPIKIEAMAVHHITEKMVEGKYPFQGSLAKDELEYLVKVGGIVVAHNAKFDLGMLLKEGTEVPKHICTLKVARYLDPEGRFSSHSLQYLRYALGLEVEGVAHDAYGDVLVLERLFERLLKKMEERAPNGSDPEAWALEKMMEISQLPSLLARCAFKKHKGKPWADVAKEDPDYLRWLLGEKRKENSPDDEDLVYTLQFYLEGNQSVSPGKSV
jgi:DNA polymerase III epsilon subunit-like protein